MTDIDSFVQTWKGRSEDAMARSDDEARAKADAILTFVNDNRSCGIALLLWPAEKVSVIATSDLKSGVFA